MMTCDEAKVLLHALLDGELDAGHAREVEAHATGCPRCTAELRQLRDVRQVMSGPNLRFSAPPTLRSESRRQFRRRRCARPHRRAARCSGVLHLAPRYRRRLPPAFCS